MPKKFNITQYKVIIFDFDGVFTDNLALIDSKGNEYVKINRSDGIGIDILKRLQLKLFIVSSEKNRVVHQRAKKLGIQCFNPINDKTQTIKQISSDLKIPLKKFIYVGNDLNDYHSMKLTGLKICPRDSHSKIKRISDIILKCKGGEGVSREIVENVFKINITNYF